MEKTEDILGRSLAGETLRAVKVRILNQFCESLWMDTDGHSVVGVGGSSLTESGG
jgi:hypothetical protein